MKKLTPILVYCCDWKETLDDKEMKEIREYCKETKDGFWQELDVTGSDDRVFVAAPMSLFEVYKKEVGNSKQFPEDCAMSNFMDFEHLIDELDQEGKWELGMLEWVDFVWDGKKLYVLFMHTKTKDEILIPVEEIYEEAEAKN